MAELERAVLEELAADGVELPRRALSIAPAPTEGWRIELRSDDGERRWREVEALPPELAPAAATVRLVILELLAPCATRGGPG